MIRTPTTARPCGPWLLLRLRPSRPAQPAPACCRARPTQEMGRDHLHTLKDCGVVRSPPGGGSHSTALAVILWAYRPARAFVCMEREYLMQPWASATACWEAAPKPAFALGVQNSISRGLQYLRLADAPPHLAAAPQIGGERYDLLLDESCSRQQRAGGPLFAAQRYR